MSRTNKGDHTAPARRPNGLPPFAAIKAFEAVGRLGGVRKAAADLSVHEAVVSRHIRALEEITGARLLERTRTGITLTSKGQRYLSRIGSALSEMIAATDELNDYDDLALKIWCAPGLAVQWLLPVLDEFQLLHPNIEIEVRPTDRMPDFGRSEADLSICYLTDAPQIGHKLTRWCKIASVPVFPVASRAIADRYRDLDTNSQFSEVPLLHNGDYTEWRAWLKAHEARSEDIAHGTVFQHSQVAIETAKRGGGILLSNMLLIGEALANGELVRVIPSTAEEDPILGAYFCTGASRRWNARPVVKFREWVIRSARASLTNRPSN